MARKRNNAAYWKNRAISMEESKEQMARALSERTRKTYIRSFRRIEKELDKLYIEILDKGADSLSRTDLYNLKRYAALRKKIAEEVEGLASNDDKALGRLLDLITTGTYRSNLKEFGMDFNLFSEGQAAAIASQNWSGVQFSARIWGSAQDFSSRVMNDVEKLVLEGRSPDKLKKKLMEDFSSKFHEADRLIRTEASHAYNSAALQSYKDAGCQYVDYLAEEDCCDLCEPYSGERYPIGDAPVIPVHPNCRCTYLPVVPGLS